MSSTRKISLKTALRLLFMYSKPRKGLMLFNQKFEHRPFVNLPHSAVSLPDAAVSFPLATVTLLRAAVILPQAAVTPILLAVRLPALPVILVGASAKVPEAHILMGNSVLWKTRLMKTLRRL